MFDVRLFLFIRTIGKREFTGVISDIFNGLSNKFYQLVFAPNFTTLLALML